MSCGVGHRRSSDPMLLWLWCRLAATAPSRPVAWEPLYAVEVAQEMAKRPKKKGKNKRDGLSIRTAGYNLFFICLTRYPRSTFVYQMITKVSSDSLHLNLLAILCYKVK